MVKGITLERNLEHASKLWRKIAPPLQPSHPHPQGVLVVFLLILHFDMQTFMFLNFWLISVIGLMWSSFSDMIQFQPHSSGCNFTQWNKFEESSILKIRPRLFNLLLTNKRFPKFRYSSQFVNLDRELLVSTYKKFLQIVFRFNRNVTVNRSKLHALSFR